MGLYTDKRKITHTPDGYELLTLESGHLEYDFNWHLGYVLEQIPCRDARQQALHGHQVPRNAARCICFPARSAASVMWR